MNTFKEEKIDKICMEMQIWGISKEELIDYYDKRIENVSKSIVSDNVRLKDENPHKEEIKFSFEILYADGKKSHFYRTDVEPIAIMLNDKLGVAMDEAESTTWDSAKNYCKNFAIGNEKWVLPDRGQLQCLYENKDVVNEILAKFGKTPLYSCYYWSSNEYDNYRAWEMYFINGSVDWGYKYYFTFNVRPVLA